MIPKNKNQETMSPLNSSEQDHILSFKTLIDNLRKSASQSFVSVREKKLSEMLDDCKVNTKFRGPVLDYLKDNGLLIVQDKRALMRYKFVESELKIDTLAQAHKAYNAISNLIKPRKSRFKKFKVPDEVIVNKINSVTKKEFAMRETVLFMKNNKIIQGKIIALRFATLPVSDESEVMKVNYEAVFADVLITSIIPEKDTIEFGLRKEDIFSSLETLFAVQKVKYHSSIATVKTA